MGDDRKDEGAGLSFEEALARLEQIVRELEGTDLTLEETLARYEEGSRLVRECTKRLDDAEQRIQVLSASRDAEHPARPPHSVPSHEDGEGDEERVVGDDLPF
jgi:exodeoxyribonuclease VII small subunit